MTENWRLGRFLQAQAGWIEPALREIHEGRKTSHWMWFIFPQLKALGSSSTARLYGIESLGEARAYLAHAVLGPRLLRAVEAVNHSRAASLRALFGPVDELKFRSSLTLFAAAEPAGPYQAALDRWFGGEGDPRTLDLLADESA